jgi:hypothetical protein
MLRYGSRRVTIEPDRSWHLELLVSDGGTQRRMHRVVRRSFDETSTARCFLGNYIDEVYGVRCCVMRRGMSEAARPVAGVPSRYFSCSPLGSCNELNSPPTRCQRDLLHRSAVSVIPTPEKSSDEVRSLKVSAAIYKL